MTETLKKQDNFPENSDEARETAAGDQRGQPAPDSSRGTEREPEAVSLGEQIRARTNRPHKGDVGRPGTNEEIFQGSKSKELK